MTTRRDRGFTLVEIMIVMAIIGIVVAIAAPTWFRQREISRARSCQENLSKIDGAKEQYAMEFRLSNGAPDPGMTALLQPNGVPVGMGYLKSAPECMSNGAYTVAAIGTHPICSIGSSTTPNFPGHEFPTAQ